MQLTFTYWHPATLPSSYLVSLYLTSFYFLSLFVVFFMNFLKLFKTCTWIYIVLVDVNIIKYWPAGEWPTLSGLSKKAWWIRALQTGESKGGLYDSFLLFHGFFFFKCQFLYLFIFIFGCFGSSFLCEGFL